MSNSSLVTYTKISPNSTNPRNHVIDTITIHHTAGVGTAAAIANIFADPAREASCNYAIGNDGSIALVVDEANRSWCSSNRENDHRAITIEVSNSAVGGNWPVSDKALKSLVALCVDICKRNNIKKLNYTGDLSGNMTMHKWFAPTSCPGPYLGGKFPWIAEQVNKELNPVPKVTSKFKVGDEVKLVSGAKYNNGAPVPSWLWNYKLYVRELQGKNVVFSTLKTGAVTGTVNEDYLIYYTEDKPVVKTEVLKAGDEIKLLDGAKYTNGRAIPKWIIDSKLYAREIQGENVVFSTLKTGAITGVVSKEYVFAPYLVKVTASVLNVRDGAGTSYKVNTAIKKDEIYTIVEEKNGWGLLKSQAGWISLDYTEKV